MSGLTAGSSHAIEHLISQLASVGYHADRQLAVALHLSQVLGRPLLLEGEPGVGKTELAKAIAKLTGRELIRLQCYDGLELRDALYEWNYPAQLLHIRTCESAGHDILEQDLYERRFLIKKPLLQAIEASPPGVVLLIDEIDRSDEPFEAFLLEFLGEYQVTIPEIGTIKAMATPWTILTSNRTRDLNDAIKRRCLYHWLDYPDREREEQILQSQVPGLPEQLSKQITGFVQRLRQSEYAQSFSRSPGIAESVEWAKALVALDAINLDPETVQSTAGVMFKHREDIQALQPMLDELLSVQE